jgi:predicted membrane-bound spermidine synthase
MLHYSQRLSPRGFRTIFAIIFTCSGFSALIYQVVWQRTLTQVMGSGAVSIVLIVTIFMLCLGLGSEITRRLLMLSNVRAIGVYAAIEICVGVYGAFSIEILRAGNEIFSQILMGSIFSDFFST